MCTADCRQHFDNDELCFVNGILKMKLFSQQNNVLCFILFYGSLEGYRNNSTEQKSIEGHLNKYFIYSLLFDW